MGFLHILLRTLHFLFAAATAVIVDYLFFGRHLRYTFLHILSLAAHYTLLSLILSLLFSFCLRSSPLGNLIRDFLSLLLFSIGLGLLLTYNASNRILTTSSCTSSLSDITPQNTCLLYKLLLLFTILSILSALANFAFDFMERRKKMWEYRQLEAHQRGMEAGVGMHDAAELARMGSEAHTMHLTPAQKYEMRRGEAAAAAGPGPKKGIKRTLTLQLGKMHGNK